MSLNPSLRATIGFGFLMTLASGFGQTFFISLFNQELRQAFSLSHGDIGLLYSAGTLMSAVAVIWAGKAIDQIDLRLYTGAVSIGLFVACLSMVFINSPVQLVLAFFLLRLFGQGLSGHTGVTTASRVNAEYRGRAVSLVGLGFSAAEVLLPAITLFFIAKYGWRDTWLIFSLIELLCIAVLAQALLRRVDYAKPRNTALEHDGHSWTRAQVMRDHRFWLIAPALFSPSIISTALLFHQQSLAQSKGFTLTEWATSIAAYTVTAALSSLVSGFLVDRYSAARVVRFFLLPFIIALGVVTFVDMPEQPWRYLPLLYYALLGSTIGIATPSVNSLWVELYGIQHVGSIRALTHACMVFGSALGPVLYGYLLDTGVQWQVLAIGSAVWMILATALLVAANLAFKAPPKSVPQ